MRKRDEERVSKKSKTSYRKRFISDPGVQSWIGKKSKYPDHLLAVDNGAFIEFWLDDALHVSRSLGLPVWCSISKKVWKRHLNQLLAQGNKVVVLDTAKSGARKAISPEPRP